MAQDQRRVSTRIRGPGDIVGEDAGKIRNSLSNTLTNSKKRKIMREAAEDAGTGLVSVADLVGGSGLVKGAIVEARHKFGARGKMIGPNVQKEVDKIFDVHAPDGEAFCKQVMPKYNIGPGFEVGTNLSPKQFSTKQSAVLGFKRALTFDMEPSRAVRLADVGVNVVNMVRLELNNQIQADWLAAGSPLPQPGPATDDNVKAAIQMSLVLAWDNINRPLNNRIPVTKDVANIEDIV